MKARIAAKLIHSTGFYEHSPFIRVGLLRKPHLNPRTTSIKIFPGTGLAACSSPKAARHSSRCHSYKIRKIKKDLLLHQTGFPFTRGEHGPVTVTSRFPQTLPWVVALCGYWRVSVTTRAHPVHLCNKDVTGSKTHGRTRQFNVSITAIRWTFHI